MVLEMFPDDEHLVRWIGMAREKVHFQGLPARICGWDRESGPASVWP